MKKIITILFILNYFSFANYITDSQGTVLNTSTFLMWQDTTSDEITFTWQESITHCEDSTTASYTNWRVPNINELITIIDLNKTNPAINSIFTNVQNNGKYWSSTTYAQPNEQTSAWYVNSRNGEVLTQTKTSKNNVRCVRNFK